MLAQIYKKNIIEKPKLVFFILLCFLIFFSFNSKNFRLDASSETLLIDGDPDLQYLNEVNKRYGSKEFLVLTYSPNDEITSDNSVNNLLSLKYKIQSLDWVHNVITILDIPLLNTKDETLNDKLQNFSTLKSEGVDRQEGFNEILNSPVFRNFVISEDGKTTGIIVYLKDRNVKADFKSKKERNIFRDKIKKQNHENILEIRNVISNYQNVAKIHLGGIPMIADDMMTFIKSDIIVFGTGVLLFIIATLWFVFKKLVWIIIPISSCLLSVVIMTGLLGILGWKVTVISSNFIALMLILTMAMNIHMSTRFLQLKKNNPNLKKSELILMTSQKMFWPIFYTVLTTIF
ncbi:MMPL family transporter, partial [Candidatus Pelagibacter sp.]|nr:MMPL family transporter [Candidatus Pelagibacter sp.]